MYVYEYTKRKLNVQIEQDQYDSYRYDISLI